MLNRKIRIFLMVLVSAAGFSSAYTVPVKAQDMLTNKADIVARYEMTEQNRALVLKAYQELFGDHDLGAVDRYWADTYIQHNPYVTDGKEALKAFLKKIGILKMPKQKVTFKRVIADGDLVMLQTVQPAGEKSPEVVIIDIFRVEAGKIAEHWDTMQAV